MNLFDDMLNSECTHGVNINASQCYSCGIEVKIRRLEERVSELEKHKCFQCEENNANVLLRERLHKRLENLEEFIVEEFSK